MVTRSNAHFMHQVHTFDYVEMAGFQFLKLPFAITGDLSMVIALPSGDKTVQDVNSSLVMQALDHLEPTLLAVALPKWHMQVTYQESLQQALAVDLGVTAPFQGDLCIYENDCSSSIQFVIQKKMFLIILLRC